MRITTQGRMLAGWMAAGMWLHGSALAARTPQAPHGPMVAGQPAPSPASVTAMPDQATIQAAVRSVVKEAPPIPRLHEADTLRANQYDVFARKAEEATVPDCLHADGLKRQPTFFLGGWLALPFVAVAKIRGKCQ